MYMGVYTYTMYVVQVMIWNCLSHFCVSVPASPSQDTRQDVEVCRAQREEAEVARQEAEAALRNTRKEMEAQELVKQWNTCV